MDNLIREGRTDGAYLTGDIMVDALEMSLRYLDVDSCLKQYDLKKGQYLYLTLHRPSNVDDPVNLKAIINALNQSDLPIIFPIHPRTKKNLIKFGLAPLLQPNIRCIDPVSHHVSISLAKCASKVLTDSGGLQKEAYLLRTPCITLRDSTEWPETVALGWNRLVGADYEAITESMCEAIYLGKDHPDFLGHHVAEKICGVLKDGCLK
jgi:UDP-N-acetylglucosamine 2-epimerase